ncbi:MAG: UDP-3-O-(3-hydroxymyristoyl)glucosamine N-acyltransferase [Proteobacteria bacterium]|nr:MAG: UDP-3-O-(3-hydroxymyristoyl)glucosamine N-acyltransferase [Pseudomonadota bacterium]
MKLYDIAKKLNLTCKGKDREISRLNKLEDADENELVYITKPKYIKQLQSTKSKAIIIPEEFIPHAPKDASLIISDEPYLIMAYISQLLQKANYKPSTLRPKISEHANIGLHVSVLNGAVIEKNVTLMPGVYVGENVYIGEGTTIHPNAVIYPNTKIGKNCTILANAVIGSDGFGYAHTKEGRHVKIYHSGNVILEDEVDIGAGTTIDRAVFASTIIKKGTKIDNLVQIGHNCILDEGCIIVSQSGLSGSTKLGRGVIMGGQSGTSGHLSIGDGAMIAARGGVMKSLEGGKAYGGAPTMPQRDWLKLQIKMLKLVKDK